MITAAEALALILAGVEPLPPETVPLAEADGRVPVAPLRALRAQPPFAASVMDGFAAGGADGPWRIVGESAAGRPFIGTLASSDAARISTGAAIPADTWGVVPREDTASVDGTVATTVAVRAGAYIRPAGYDFAADTVLAEPGVPLTPARLALLAAGGYGTVPVHRRPVVALLLTGDELRPPGAALGPGQIADSNGPMLSALLRRANADVRTEPTVADTRAAVRAVLDAVSAEADVVITCGGASGGEHDHLPAAVSALGTLMFQGVAIRPGKPFFFGSVGRARVLGLPGNPAAAYLTAQLFVLPLLRALGGYRQPQPRVVTARLATAVPAGVSRADYVWARLADGTVTPLPATDSGALLSLAQANAAVVRSPFAQPAAAGDLADTLRLDSAD